MTTKDTGGPAFPSPEWSDAHGNIAPQEYGMTLRDYFAAKAMKYMGLPTKVGPSGCIGDNTWSLQEMQDFPYDDMAQVAYRWADAMLAERRKQ